MVCKATLSLVGAIALTTTFVAATSASEVQRWSVHFVDEVAVIRVSESTAHNFVTATISSLQQEGVARVELRALELGAELGELKSSYSVLVDDNVAEIRASEDVPLDVLVSLTDRLKEAGMKEIKFAAPTNVDQVPASDR